MGDQKSTIDMNADEASRNKSAEEKLARPTLAQAISLKNTLKEKYGFGANEVSEIGVDQTQSLSENAIREQQLFELKQLRILVSSLIGENEIWNRKMMEISSKRMGNEIRMSESYEGVVETRSDEHVWVRYYVGEDLVEQTYEKNQFIDDKLPEVGTCLRVSVLVTSFPPKVPVPDEAPDENDAPDQRLPWTGEFKPG